MLCLALSTDAVSTTTERTGGVHVQFQSCCPLLLLLSAVGSMWHCSRHWLAATAAAQHRGTTSPCGRGGGRVREEGLRSGGWMPCAMVPQMRVHRARFCVSSGELPLAPPLAGVHDSQSSRAVTRLPSCCIPAGLFAFNGTSHTSSCCQQRRSTRQTARLVLSLRITSTPSSPAAQYTQGSRSRRDAHHPRGTWRPPRRSVGQLPRRSWLQVF